MIDFDAHLRERLQRLDDAIPSPLPPEAATDERQAELARVRQPRRRRGRKLVVLLAAAALLVATGAAAAGRLLFPDVPQPALEAALEEVFAASGCITATEATDAIRARLDAMGHGDWEIETRPGTEHPRCVSAGLISPQHVVVLLPAAGRDVAEALEGVRDELLRQCLGRDEAIQLVSSVLTSLGATDFRVSADPWGPQGAPMDQLEAYQSHVAAGCYVYSAMGYDADGKAIHYLWGR
ncbi:MAG: hypothetical protein H0X16_06865 [Chloroflexi bacterium]|nr:hypothetical protein [Chloroflexota bacterium]